jgi:alkanesulfonate monooxygenase SsuD/methylene tetrahydromethanopterin reductase-like flavin-dependent oxidoreductase (luciferase family)
MIPRCLTLTRSKVCQTTENFWFGVGGPRTLELTGRFADGWAPPKHLLELHDRTDEAALEAGRRPEEIKRLYKVSGRIGPEGEG